MTSTAIIWLNKVGLAPKTSSIAPWLAPPPIQLPATVANPRHTSSAPAPEITSGDKSDAVNKANGPPMITPIVPARNITKAFGPSLTIPLKSILKVKSTKDAGNKYLDATVYKPDSSPEIRPKVFNKPGVK